MFLLALHLGFVSVYFTVSVPWSRRKRWKLSGERPSEIVNFRDLFARNGKKWAGKASTLQLIFGSYFHDLRQPWPHPWPNLAILLSTYIFAKWHETDNQDMHNRSLFGRRRLPWDQNKTVRNCRLLFPNVHDEGLLCFCMLSTICYLHPCQGLDLSVLYRVSWFQHPVQIHLHGSEGVSAKKRWNDCCVELGFVDFLLILVHFCFCYCSFFGGKRGQAQELYEGGQKGLVTKHSTVEGKRNPSTQKKKKKPQSAKMVFVLSVSLCVWRFCSAPVPHSNFKVYKSVEGER